MLKKRLGGSGSVLVVLAVPAMAMLMLSPWNLDSTSASEELSAKFAVDAGVSPDEVLDLSGWEYTGHDRGKGKSQDRGRGKGKGPKMKKSPSGPPPGKGGPPPHAKSGPRPPAHAKSGPKPPPHAKNKK